MARANRCPHAETQARKLRRLRALSRLLDDAIRVPGTSWRFGLDGIIGLAPVAGDLLTTACSAYIIWEAARLGAPAPMLARMGLNLLLDFAAGSVPVVGDLFDLAWKANMKNVDLLESYLNQTGPGHPGKAALDI